MSKISFILRKTSKTSEEAAIYVKHTHKGSPYTKATGVQVVPKYFDLKAGKVLKLTAAPEMNQKIESVRKVLEKAARDLIGKGVEPNAANMDFQCNHIWFSKIVEGAKKEEETQLVNQVASSASKDLKSELDILYEELADLERQVIEKKAYIENMELALGLYSGKLVSNYVLQYKADRSTTLKPNSLRLFTNVAEWVVKFNPTWQMQDVTIETLRAFQNFLLGEGKQSQTVTDIITKLKSVVYYYARSLKLDTSELKEFKFDYKKKQQKNPIYLTRQELQDLMDLEILKPTEKQVRDMFVLMSLTGVRFSDAFLTKDDIVDNHIRVSTNKTDSDILIPIAPKVREILEEYDYTFKSIPSTNFNDYIKDICSRVPSIANRKELKKEYRGADISKKYKSKAQMISCHVGRKTFINLALEKGINPVAIAEIVGHEGTDLIMTTYGNKSAGKEQLASIF